MKIHFRLLVTIGNLVSLSSLPLSGQVRGQGSPPPPNERPVHFPLLGKMGPSSRAWHERHG